MDTKRRYWLNGQAGIVDNYLFFCAWSDITPGDLLKSVDRGVTWDRLNSYLHTFMT